MKSYENDKLKKCRLYARMPLQPPQKFNDSRIIIKLKQLNECQKCKTYEESVISMQKEIERLQVLIYTGCQ